VGDSDGDGVVDVAELVQAVNVALTGCTEGTCQDPLPPGDCTPPATGQTTSYGPGSDGDVQAGAKLSYTDNGDGTVTDNNTELMWEKKDDAGGIHDWDKTYTWSDSEYTMNGTMVTTFLAALNTLPCFAGHCDWRIPNAKELQSIVNYENYFPAVSVEFNTGCTGGCSVTTCSCTPSNGYWSSTASAYYPNGAWGVYFDHGYLRYYENKSINLRVRAVRGGL
jgi:hypothetical protein